MNCKWTDLIKPGSNQQNKVYCLYFDRMANF